MAKHKQFKGAVKDAATIRSGLEALIPQKPEDVTEDTLRQIAAQRLAAGIGTTGRPPRKDKDNKAAPAAERGTKPGEMRKTVLVNKEKYSQLALIAYHERIKEKEALDEALTAYIDQYIKQHGPIQPKKDRK